MNWVTMEEENKLTFKCGFQTMLERVEVVGQDDNQTNVSFKNDIYVKHHFEKGDGVFFKNNHL